MMLTSLSPISFVRVLSKVPLDSSYTDTLKFSELSEQTNYFNAKSKRNFSNLTPIRLQNAVRLPVNADYLFDCNYLSFTNYNFGYKIFYCFITKVEFININSCNVYFDIDIMQTWMFDYTLKPSFVEREMVNDDSIGANIVQENVETGYYLTRGIEKFGINDSNNIYVVTTSLPEREFDGKILPAVNFEGGMYGGVYSGSQIVGFSDPTAVNLFIKSLVDDNKKDAISGIFMGSARLMGSLNAPTPSYNVSVPKYLDSISGYSPKNNKLFTHPYNGVCVTNMEGTIAELKYELFSGGSCEFQVIGSGGSNPECSVLPLNYGGASVDYRNRIALSGFPQCSFSTSSYDAWLAQSAGPLALSTAGGVGGAIVGGAMAATGVGAVVGVVGAAVAIGSTIMKSSIESMKPPQANGAPCTNNLFSSGMLDFFAIGMQITASYAKQIDDYFSMYGYAINETKVPNVTGRPSWNYVKTLGAKITGSIPFDDMEKIKAIYDRGITFWHGDFVGDYTRGNK